MTRVLVVRERYRTYMAADLPGLLDAARLEQERAEAVAELEQLPKVARQRDFVEGALAGLSWLLGHNPAPLSNAPEATREAILREEQIADDAIHRVKDAPDVRQGWAVGLQHALMWGRGKTSTPPVSFD